jgi:hypothetical protein
MRQWNGRRLLNESRPRWMDPPQGPFGPISIHATAAIELVSARQVRRPAA